MATRSCERKKLNGPICAGTIRLGIMNTLIACSVSELITNDGEELDYTLVCERVAA